MRHQGHISSWKDDKGFGFITPAAGGEKVFVHISAFTNRRGRPEVDDRVTYELRADAQGRAQAGEVAFLDRRRTSSFRPRRLLPLLVAASFLGVLAYAVNSGRVPALVLVVYLAASVVAFMAYALDKWAAVKGRWRTQESTLHFFALVGGWPGALAAQDLLRHKSSKVSFQVTFWVTVIVNCGALGWLLSASGAVALRSALRLFRTAVGAF